jgi:hypothetical protein
MKLVLTYLQVLNLLYKLNIIISFEIFDLYVYILNKIKLNMMILKKLFQNGRILILN